jgi:hypothetical protein
MKKKLRPHEADAKLDLLGVIHAKTKELDNGLVVSTPETFLDLFLDLGEQDGYTPMAVPPKGPQAPQQAG